MASTAGGDARTAAQAVVLDTIKYHVNHVGSPGELPTAEEILQSDASDWNLPEMNVNGPHSCKTALLTAQYKILRTEGIEGLRFSVNCFKSNPGMKDDKHTCVYTDVRIKGYLMTRIGPVCRIEFSTSRAGRKIKWLQSRRLTPGTALALTTAEDRFQSTCIVASVVQRPVLGGLDQSPPEIDIMWADVSHAVFDPNQTLVMIEARTGYFEAVRYALLGLQLAAKYDSPLDKYIVTGDKSDSSTASVRSQPVLDVTKLAQRLPPAISEESTTEPTLRASLIECNLLSGIPDLGDWTTLDSSQLKAIHRILTKEMAIVQGPPGTGKTFTSVTGLDIMLSNRMRGDPPIIVAAQTNHALDMLLAHLMNRGARVLRVGGRTEDEAIALRTTFALRQQYKLPDPNFRKLERQRQENIQEIQKLANTVFARGLLDPLELKEAGIISEDQYKSLYDENCTNSEDEGMGPFSTWLGEEGIPAQILRETQQLLDNEEEEDEEAADIADPDIQVVPIVEEDLERDRLRGTWIPLSEAWTGLIRQLKWRTTAEKLLDRVSDLWDIPKPHRGAVYQVLQARILTAKRAEFTSLLVKSIQCCKSFKINKWERDVQLVHDQDINVVGCTTTGLGKYRGFLAALHPRIMLIEEAAQTREANITAALFPSLQQLVLVGDHQQLTPHCDVQWLGCHPYNINVSLFERMANLKVPITTLNQQRRMIPDIRRILGGFYPTVRDHPLVCDLTNRPPIPGMGASCWLFDHYWPEATDSDQSKFNQNEAEMIANFTIYLIQNGTPASKITILTYYNGQRKLILRLLKRHPSVAGSTFRVCTVDSYQGEENDVILLSLVRSPVNKDNYSVGFLEDENRAVVAVSRAKRGFYMFCNVDNILRASEKSFDIWVKVWNGFAEQKYVERDSGLPVVCQKHENKAWMTEPKSFDGNAGGCWVKCDEKRHCGHNCRLMCHPTAHEDLPCSESCSASLDCGHTCSNLCGEPCSCTCDVYNKKIKVIETPHAIFESMPLTEALVHQGASPAFLSYPQGCAAKRNQPSDRPLASSITRQGVSYSTAAALGPSNARQRTAKAVWESFTQNAPKFDQIELEQHRAEQSRRTGPQRSRQPVITDTFHQQILVDGKRTGVGKAVPIEYAHGDFSPENPTSTALSGSSPASKSLEIARSSAPSPASTIPKNSQTEMPLIEVSMPIRGSMAASGQATSHSPVSTRGKAANGRVRPSRGSGSAMRQGQAQPSEQQTATQRRQPQPRQDQRGMRGKSSNSRGKRGGRGSADADRTPGTDQWPTLAETAATPQHFSEQQSQPATVTERDYDGWEEEVLGNYYRKKREAKDSTNEPVSLLDIDDASASKSSANRERDEDDKKMWLIDVD